MLSEKDLIILLEQETGLKINELLTQRLSHNEIGYKVNKKGNITELYLNEAGLTEFPESILKFQNLEKLSLWYNHIEFIPDELAELKKLTTLYLTGNKLHCLPRELIDLPNLVYLECANNPLKEPPIEIAIQGMHAVKAYFKSLEKGKRPLNEVKVLFVGDGGSGKTSLLKRIRGEEFDWNEVKTHGINIKSWTFDIGEDEANINFWDFGGQEIMHSTHQFFLSKRSVYVLVLDGRRDSKVEYWLKLIESLAGKSPVLVVINKVDENPAFDVNRLFLKEKYPYIQGFYRISCATNAGIDVFIEGLKNVLAEKELLQAMWSVSWFNVKSRLENLNKDYIGYDKYIEICDSLGVDDKKCQDTLVEFLNDLGVILHFKDYDLLDTHVLEPRWVTGAVYKIINSKKLSETKGKLCLDMLDEILKQEKDSDFFYPRDKYKFIIGLMKKFELCFEIDGNTVLIPDLLEIQESSFTFDYDSALKFIIEYEFLPKSVIPRFIVKRNKDIKDDLHWRTGVVLEEKNFRSVAVVKADEMEKRIYIFVNGQQKRNYFSVIRKTFKDINASFNNLEIKELVPIQDENDVVVQYDELISYELAKKEEIFVWQLSKNFSVQKLLDGIEDAEERQKFNNSNQQDIIVNNKIVFPDENTTTPNKKKKWYEASVWKMIAAVAAFILTVVSIMKNAQSLKETDTDSKEQIEKVTNPRDTLLKDTAKFYKNN